MLDADREADHVLRHAGGVQLTVVELRVRRRRRVDRERLGVADVGQVREQLQAVDERTAGIATVKLGGGAAKSVIVFRDNISFIEADGDAGKLGLG